MPPNELYSISMAEGFPVFKVTTWGQSGHGPLRAGFKAISLWKTSQHIFPFNLSVLVLTPWARALLAFTTLKSLPQIMIRSVMELKVFSHWRSASLSLLTISVKLIWRLPISSLLGLSERVSNLP